MSRLGDLFTRRSPSLVGLDIGSSAVKAVELEATRTGFRVVAAGSAPVPRDAIVDGTIVDGGRVADAIRGAYQADRFRARTVAASLAGSAVLVRRITVPQMSDSELDESIYWEVDQYVPVDVGDVTLDYQVLDGTSDERPRDTMDVLLVVGRKDRIGDCTSVIERAGLAPAVVDVGALALHNAYESSYGVDRDSVVMLVDAGASTVTTAVVRRGRLDFTRDATLARRVHVIDESLGTTGDAAGEDVDSGERGGRRREATAEAVAIEVERTMEDCCAEGAEDSPQRVVVSGGWSCAPGFNDALAERIGVPVARFEPFRGLEVTPRATGCDLLAAEAPAAAVAAGLARRRGDDR